MILVFDKNLQKYFDLSECCMNHFFDPLKIVLNMKKLSDRAFLAKMPNILL